MMTTTLAIWMSFRGVFKTRDGDDDNEIESARSEP